MPVAYVILVHEAPYQVARLLWALWDRDNTYIVHVDAKIHEDFFRLIVAMAKAYDNVFVVRGKGGTWGGYSLVRFVLASIRYALKANDSWNHLVVLSGTHLPLCSAKETCGFLSDKKSVMSAVEIPVTLDQKENGIMDKWESGIAQRIIYEYKELPGIAVLRNQLRAAIPNSRFYYGSQWMVLARKHCLFLLSAECTEWEKFFESSLIPDEMFFQTCLLNNKSIENEVFLSETTFLKWTKFGRPAELGLDGFQEGIDKRFLFARKFGNGRYNSIETLLDRNASGLSMNAFFVKLAKADPDLPDYMPWLLNKDANVSASASQSPRTNSFDSMAALRRSFSMILSSHLADRGSTRDEWMLSMWGHIDSIPTTWVIKQSGNDYNPIMVLIRMGQHDAVLITTACHSNDYDAICQRVSNSQPWIMADKTPCTMSIPPYVDLINSCAPQEGQIPYMFSNNYPRHLLQVLDRYLAILKKLNGALRGTAEC
jgi:hypothetical protein